MKVEASVLPSGKALNWTKTFVGSVSDITILRKNMEFHRLCTRKTMEDEGIEDSGGFCEGRPHNWGI